MTKIRHILCPVDLSDPSLRALQHASALAGWYESSLTALYVDTTLPIEGASDFEDFAIAPSAVVEAGRSTTAARDLRTFVGRASCHTAVNAVVEESSSIDAAILERAQTLPADLIVMGSHGRSGVGRLLIGSVTEHVLRTAPCPVMVVPPHDAVATSVVAFTHIVCAIDFSESSLAGLTWALSLAEEADAHLSLVNVIEVPPELRVSAIATGDNLDELRAAFDADTLARLRSLVPAHAAEFCSVETATAAGAAGHAILKYAQERNADLIVMGAQGHGPLERWIFGSKTRDVVSRATCPVLTVRR